MDERFIEIELLGGCIKLEGFQRIHANTMLFETASKCLPKDYE